MARKSAYPLPVWYNAIHNPVDRKSVIYHANWGFGSQLVAYLQTTGIGLMVDHKLIKTASDGHHDKTSVFYNRSDLYSSLLSPALTTRTYVLYNEVIDDYDMMAIAIADQLGLRIIFISPNPVIYKTAAIDMRLKSKPKLVNVRNLIDIDNADLVLHIRNTVEAGDNVLIITPSPTTTVSIVNALDGLVITGDEVGLHKGKFETGVAIASDRLTDRLMNIRYAAIYVFPTTKTEVDLAIRPYPRKIIDRDRMQRELQGYEDLLTDRGTLYRIRSDGAPDTLLQPFGSKNAYNATMLALVFNKSGKKIQYDARHTRRLQELDLIDSNNNFTNIGAEIMAYSDDILGGLFMYKWVQNNPEGNKFYPGLVISAFIEETPTLSRKGVGLTTFHDYMTFWNELIHSSPTYYKYDEMSTWMMENGYAIAISAVGKILKALSEKKHKFNAKEVLFSVEGAVTRCTPIFTKVFETFIVKRIDETENYLHEETGELFKLSQYELAPAFAILRKGVVFPVDLDLIKSKGSGSGPTSELLDLPHLPMNIDIDYGHNEPTDLVKVSVNPSSMKVAAMRW